MKVKIKGKGAGQLAAAAGNLVMGIGLLLNGFELVAAPVFKAIVFSGVFLDVIALFVILKKS